ncbi:MAG: 5-formyltetrahydrofolate cyclo-ligase [Candidatus Pelagibacter sp.]|nr:5-formyltetrahydrofolate cyclo-ligase [Candidatus Pelagibacter sp.]OUV97939.1 MAG: 5-formyltetrahydrofolate cyclo-ligase [Candidatus Pelagibacter sp. TMED142]|tara:strand:+ start:1228 stop:1776 length:549 start_codon:yes stop_codon:yes gene_type:complete
MKSFLRRKYFHLRKKKYFELSDEKKQFILKKIIYILKKNKKKRVGIFYPIKFEINIFSILIKNNFNFSLLLPFIKTNKLMVFKKWNNLDPLIINNKFGIPEPLKKNITLSPDALIVPLLAFDKNKNRLGYGGGYYDRYLNNQTKKNILLIGLGFSFQKSKIVPFTKYDKKMDYIITEKETIY